MTAINTRRLFSVLFLLAANPIFAHTPYYTPSSFEAINEGMVTLDASFAEKFFVPEVAFEGSDFKVITPKGLELSPDSISQLKTRTVVEHLLKEDGTYRFSTGKRLGAIFTVYEHEGERKTARGTTSEIPTTAKILERYQSLTLAETYVSKGEPSRGAISPKNQGLEIIPETHPNDLFAGDNFNFHVHLDGKPLDGIAVEAYLAKNQFSLDKPTLKLTTAEDGKLSMPFKDEGVYLLRVRHRAPAPKNADAPTYSHTYTLVVEVYN